MKTKKVRLFYCRFCGKDGYLPNGGRLTTCKECGKDGIVHANMSHEYLKENIDEIRATGLQIHCMVHSFFKKVK